MLVMAWLAGEGIVSWRWFKQGAPPPPGSLLAVSGFFALLAVLGQYAPARGVAAAIAVGIDIAALLQVLPGTTAPGRATGWPPALINDPTVLLPGTAATPSKSNPSGGSGPGGSMPAGPNQLPPGQTPPPGQGVIFPPGSSKL